MSEFDFTRRKNFPGTRGSAFGAALHQFENIESIPAPLFAALLILPALIVSRVDVVSAIVYYFFVLGDWALLAALPRFRRSFGPSQPPTFLLAALRLPLALLPWVAIPIQLVGTALVVYGFWIEPHRLTLTRQTLHSSKLKRDAPGLRILHLGDIHIERMTGREERLIEMVRELAPDLILYSGDFLNLSYVHDETAHRDLRMLWSQISAPLGVYAVSGSPGVDEPQLLHQLLPSLDIQWLRDQRVTIDKAGQQIDVVGITCTHRPFDDAPRLAHVLGGGPDRFTILLYHTPDLAPEAAELGIDLQLSGHTHGGQVRLPFYGALFTSSLYGKKFESGLRRVRDMVLYVTRGIGMEGKAAPRVRFLCPPEIILWEVAPAVEG